jgi:hypothetical protein
MRLELPVAIRETMPLGLGRQPGAHALAWPGGRFRDDLR